MWWWFGCSGPIETVPDPRAAWGGSGPSDDTDPTASGSGAAPGTTADTGAACVPTTGTPVGLPLSGVTLGTTVPLGPFADTPSWPSVTPVSTDGGGPLLFSDSPETVDGPGVAYGDTITGEARLYLYHATGSGSLSYGVVARGVGGAATVEVTAEGTAGPSADYLYTGRMGALRWLTARREAAGPRVSTVPDGVWTSLDPTVAAATVTTGRLMHGIWDVNVTGTAELRFVAVRAGDDVATAVPGLSVLARDTHDRGTFAPSERHLAVPCVDTAAEAVRLRLADGTTDPFATGTDALGSTASSLAGNYGVHYTLELDLRSTDGRSLALLLAPRGGPVAGAVDVSAGVFPAAVYDFPSDRDDVPVGQAVLLGAWDPTRTPRAEVRWTPAGSSSLPVDLLLVPFLR